MGKREFTGDEPEFDDWWEQLNELAKGRKLTWCLSSEQEDHRDGFEAGDSPEDELANQCDAANS